MKNLNLKSFYDKIIRNLKVALGYTEIDGLDFIIRASRLKPFDYFFNNLRQKVVLHRTWFDEFGNTFNINKNKNIEIIKGDTRLINYNIPCTDLYYGLSLDKIFKISSLVQIIVGKFEENEYYFLNFLGIDNYFRTFIIYKDQIIKISPLELGFDNLHQMYENRKIRYFLKCKLKKINFPDPCEKAESWISYIPVHRDFIKLLEDKSPELANILNRIE